jgi:AraC-like DNA-binding protein
MIHWQGYRGTAGVTLLLTMAEEFELSREQCLCETGINETDLHKPNAQIRIWQELALLRNIQGMLGPEASKGLGVRVGSRYGAADLGLLGLAMQCSTSPAHAFRVAEKYRLSDLSFSSMSFLRSERGWRMELDASAVPPDCRRFCIERGLTAVFSLLQNLLQQSITPRAVKMSIPPPDNLDVFEAVFHCPVQFEQPENVLELNVDVMYLPLPCANATALKTCEYYCNELVKTQQAQEGIVGRVRDTLTERGGEVLSMDDLANSLSISTRTLRRLLAKEGYSYRQLMLEVRMSLARQLLCQGMGVEQVATSIGYAEIASFSRAFKRWFGFSPSGK